MSDCTEQSFLKDVAKHELTLLRDDGVHRHLLLKEPGTRNFAFELITWPGCLCFTGDMGTYVFQRLEDMLEFFRTDQAQANGNELKINRGYWSEKLIAVDSSGRRGGSAVEFSPVRFQRMVKEQLVTWWRDSNLTREQRRELREEVESQVLSRDDDVDVRAYDALQEFEHDIDGRTFRFTDSWEWDLTDYTYHFTWCCYALAWAVKQYDKAKQSSAELFYLQDSRQHVGNDVLWWGKGGNGYVTDLNKAQLYTKAQAVQMHESRPSDIPWPAAYIQARARPAVDMQYIKLSDALDGTGIELKKREVVTRHRERHRCSGCGKFLSDARFWAGACPACGTDSRP